MLEWFVLMNKLMNMSKLQCFVILNTLSVFVKVPPEEQVSFLSWVTGPLMMLLYFCCCTCLYCYEIANKIYFPKKICSYQFYI